MKNLKIKTILFAIALITLIGCSDSETKTRCYDSKIRILNKRREPFPRGGNYCHHALYVYNGVSSEWYETDELTWGRYSINDTLPALVLVITKWDKK